MKKVLFATTALVATAGVAAADVTFGGYGRFGVLYQGSKDAVAAGATNASDQAALFAAEREFARANADTTTTPAQLKAAQDDVAAKTLAANRSAGSNAVDDATDITSRFRLQITATAESDMGVTFGGMVRLEGEERDAAKGSRAQFNGVRYFARSGGLEVAVGNIYGALEFMPGQYPIDLGLTGHSYEYSAFNSRADAYQSGSLGSDGSNGVEVIYKLGDLSFHMSASDLNDRVAAHVAYNYNGFTFAAAVQDSDMEGSATEVADTEFALSVGGTVGPADVALTWARNGDDTGAGTLNGDHYVLAASFDVGAATQIDAYVADADYFANTSYGVGVHHDLGGGVSLRGGVSSTSADQTLVDLGVRFNF